MSKRILCPYHVERTPSCQVYHDGIHCFGCGRRGPLSDAGLSPEQAAEPVEPEDLAEAFTYIDSLPLSHIRGLDLPADDRSYFIPWPGKDYYKRRFYDPKGSKYIGARGHKKPLFWARQGRSTALVIVEGELNALSIAKACPQLDVCSPGGAGDFVENRFKRHLHSLVSYSIILTIADGDTPGALAAIEVLGLLRARGYNARQRLFSPDANDILVQRGETALRNEVYQALGQEPAGAQATLEEGA